MVCVTCTICLEDNLAVSALRNLPCGHAFCEPCIIGHIDATKRKRGPQPSCPQCRTGPISKKDLRPVFIQFADGSSASQLPPGEDANDGDAANDALRKQLRHVKKGLDRLGPEAPVTSVETAAEKIETFREVDDVAVLGQLVGVVASWFNTKGVEVYTEVLDLRERISEIQATQESAALAHQVELDKRAKMISRLEDDNARLHNRLGGVEEREAAARAQAGDLARVRRECEELRKRVMELTRNRDSLSAMLDQNKEKLLTISARNKKYKAEAQQLRVQVTDLQEKIAVQDDARSVAVYENEPESLVVGDYSVYHNDYEESPHLQKRRKLDDLDINSSPPRGSSSSPPRAKLRFPHVPSSPVAELYGNSFRSDWAATSHQTTKKLRMQESPKKTLPFPGISTNGRPTAKANLVLGTRMRMSKNS
ncbi:unnamed protein product [Peniophora sp. CBMAI 1063]|nr:unnamed protein product [Peniophora sp. CBMAI 1063]